MQHHPDYGHTVVDLGGGRLVGLGRAPRWDDRNRDFVLPKKRVPVGVNSRYWSVGEVLNQGDTPQCVGYAGWGWLRGGPVLNKPKFSPTDLYHWAQEKDEWPGEAYEGSSTLGLMQALKDKGLISEYRWALDLDAIVNWVLTTGPILTGTWWFRDMFDPDKDGYIHPQGTKDGGHEWRIRGANRVYRNPDKTYGRLRMVNSWNKSWGQNGQAWITFHEYADLLHDEGDAVTPTELLVK